MTAPAECDDVAAFVANYDLLATRVYGVVLTVVRDVARTDAVAERAMQATWRSSGHTRDTAVRTSAEFVTTAHRHAVAAIRSDADRAPCAPHVAARQPPCEVSGALADLPDGQRQAIELAYFQGCSLQDISSTLGVPHSTVGAWVRTGLTTLHATLEGRD